MIDEYLNYLNESSATNKCKRIQNKIIFHRKELAEEYVNLKKCKTYWLDSTKASEPEWEKKKYREHQYKRCVVATKEWIKKRKAWLNETEQKYREHCR